MALFFIMEINVNVYLLNCSDPLPCNLTLTLVLSFHPAFTDADPAKSPPPPTNVRFWLTVLDELLLILNDNYLSFTKSIPEICIPLTELIR